MEKKKQVSKTPKKTTKKVTKNVTTKKVEKKTKKKKGFTLIELLAVIIILGILMIIAIPSVTSYISNSRKSTYVDTAKGIISGARNLVNEGKLEMFDTDTTYYIDINCIKTENGTQSPYGEFTKAYVVVTYDGKGYDYYWTSIDEVGNGIKTITNIDKLDEDDIESDLKVSDIKDTIGIDGRNKYMIIDNNTNCGKSEYHFVTGDINGETGMMSPIEYPDGKTKNTVTTGDLIKIGNEGFYLIKRDGSNLILMAQYNLKVGNIYNENTKIGSYSPSDEGYGLQSSECGYYRGITPCKCSISFSDKIYWYNKIGTVYSGSYSYNDFPYVYDQNSLIYPHVENYKKYLESLGANIKQARLISIQELIELGCTYDSSNGTQTVNCTNVPSFIYAKSYWTGSAVTNNYLWRLSSGSYGWVQGNYNHFYNSEHIFGIRPIIVI